MITSSAAALVILDVLFVHLVPASLTLGVMIMVPPSTPVPIPVPNFAVMTPSVMLVPVAMMFLVATKAGIPLLPALQPVIPDEPETPSSDPQELNAV